MVESDDSTDLEWLKRWAAGDRASGNRLFRRHFAAVFRFFRFKVGPAADELTQKTFLGVLENAHRIDPQRGFRGYLFGVARNQLLMYLRSQKRDAGRFDPHSWSLADAGLGAVQLVAKHREEHLVASALARLPLDYQCTLELFYWESLSIGEIAVALGSPEGTIKARLSRGRQMLRDVLERQSHSVDLLRSTVDHLERWLIALPNAVPRATDGPGRAS